jgi:hydrogenase nickel incorporation protein HypA/HybF
MHELHIAQRIIDTIATEALKNNISKVHTAKLKIGKMAAFDKEQLEFALASSEKNETLEGMKFDVNEIPVELECKDCGHHFIDKRFDEMDFAHQIAHAPALYIPPKCPVCGSEDVALLSGNEMELLTIEGE